ncbi:MAG: DNA mismatch repair endonuclease MutL [Faecalibacterium prausnitzii]|uniref:DNA mismatch repair endonuclease MutL n=1 Tax=Faecalibacterium prausnitzii TaxID=853 RepID=UPI001C2CB573|nr:DNA mismatch repair endonuclease MutL [Faecalibacterium prausnitzii]MBV0896675.1 DNA mismatch repair endonuclease MutL [Faecalibacterium prausnitzii]MCQ5162010.1 DNA mismatch repair endonuclease MutL [Faecalibacterium prausnitzii]MCQ5175511.1 DNA mismatch repair endonuclease MutL [Faecalibacterium prausnitzii]MEE1538703.1 DNA mismatch repair endonuclease MutL [Faecalibacterium prausnitzii]
MAVIHVLDKHTAELIAAGEVVERPASVVKELLENSIDAGATQVTVSIESGGVKLIEISDNGTGIDAEYIPTAFIRHATSKIEKPDDLNSIHTLGFRGEALASIASVARVELLTRTEVDEFATCYRIAGGEEQGREPAARAVGTTIRVQDLFYNTPARMKFLKKDSSEGTFVADNVGHVALSHPEVSVKFIREGKLQYVTPGDGQLRSAAYAVLGREFSRDLIEVHSEEGLYRVTGLITPPKSCRASRSMQHFYINGRYVRNRTIMAGMEMAFKGTTMQGKFPGGILLLEMPTDLVDVNVHPAKIEARFARENDVFDVVYHAVKLALAQPGTGERRFTFEADEREKTEKENDTQNENTVKNNHFTGLSAVIPGQADPGTLPAQRWEAPQPPRPAAAPVKTPSFTADTPPVQPAPPARAAAVPSWRQSAPAEDILDPVVTLHSPEKPDATEVQIAPRPFRAAAGEAQLDVHPETDATADPLLDHMAAWNTVPAAPEIEAATVPYQPEEPVQSEQPEQLGFDVPQGEEPLRYVGEVFRTYILAERGDELCLIDKHAAHERQLYEKLAANYGNVPSQLLLQPAAIDLSAEEKQALLENLPLLENAGLDVADFGGSTVLLRAVPADVEPQNAEDLLVEIADRLLKGSRDALNEHTEWVLHSISCRAAIKAGDKSSPQELMALAEKILSGEVPPFCPHGRPCVLKLTRKELEKQFGRIV